MLTQKELKEVLNYNLETGELVWRISRGTRKAGDIAGTLNALGYVVIRIKGKLYLAHRLAWFIEHGRWPKEIDHINHGKADNRWVNLREITHQENMMNQPLRKSNTSGVCGVDWHKRDNKWRSKIMIDGKTLHLGYFTDKLDAITARKEAENKYGFHENHGEIL
ncbi:MAG: HNH endonuclease [Desulfobacteraceae bacterium]|nr:HNH endonuclease [Desulfobacteraceae bacterium]